MAETKTANDEFEDPSRVCKGEELAEVMVDLKKQYEDDPETVAKALGYKNDDDEPLLEKFKEALKESGIGKPGLQTYEIYEERLICEDLSHGGEVFVPKKEVDEYSSELPIDFQLFDQKYIMNQWGYEKEEAKEELESFGFTEPMYIASVSNHHWLNPATLSWDEWFEDQEILEYYGLDNFNYEVRGSLSSG